ncbi:MAG TPA: hypothetical protein VKB70_01595 [Gaiellaceae bacterium]|nr:hypothetical protein [Gaiellaceae bacterium]
MKIWTLTLAAVLAVSAGAFGVGQALAKSTTHQPAPKTLQIVMRDPGCHWFKLGGKYTTKATFKGRVRLVDLDMAALRVASRRGMRQIPKGGSIVVSRGSYVIMMVGQAADDNYLSLTVR